MQTQSYSPEVTVGVQITQSLNFKSVVVSELNPCLDALSNPKTPFPITPLVHVI